MKEKLRLNSSACKLKIQRMHLLPPAKRRCKSVEGGGSSRARSRLVDERRFFFFNLSRSDAVISATGVLKLQPHSAPRPSHFTLRQYLCCCLQEKESA